MKLALTILGVFLSLAVCAQQFQRCATTEAVAWREANFTRYKRAVESTYQQVKEIIAHKGR
jgi:hypothetical protein